MSAIDFALEVSLPSTEFEHQALMIIVPNNLKKKPMSPQSSFYCFPQNNTPFSENNNSFHDSNASLKDEMEVQEA